VTELAPHEKHNVVTDIIVRKLLSTFPDETDLMIALESVVLGVLASCTTDSVMFAAYLALITEGVQERLEAYHKAKLNV
jgi:hypothetical protein